MRNIKYRQFVNGEFHCWGYINHSENGKPEFTGPIKPLDGSFVSSDQFTGLTDKNGVEIYEGDILQMDDLFVPVEFNDGCFQIYTNKSQGASQLMQMRAKRFAVVGNIHQHPELLK